MKKNFRKHKKNIKNMYIFFLIDLEFNRKNFLKINGTKQQLNFIIFIKLCVVFFEMNV